MDADRKKILERLKKLYALGQSPNQHEAELAMAKASQIMQEYQIGATEIDMADAGHILREDMVVAKGDGVRYFVYQMARAAATMFDGQCAYASSKTSITFIGTPTDIEAMKMTFIHLYKSWESICEHDLRNAKENSIIKFEPRDTMRYKHGHGVGFAKAVDRRADDLQAQRQQDVSNASATGRSLIVVKNTAVADYMKQAGYKSAARKSSAGDFGGRMAGSRAGEAIPLGGGIGGNEQRKQIGSR